MLLHAIDNFTTYKKMESLGVDILKTFITNEKVFPFDYDGQIRLGKNKFKNVEWHRYGGEK